MLDLLLVQISSQQFLIYKYEQLLKYELIPMLKINVI